MFMGMQDFDFLKSKSNLIKFIQPNHFCPNFASILPKFRLILPISNQIYQNLINFAQKIFAPHPSLAPTAQCTAPVLLR